MSIDLADVTLDWPPELFMMVARRLRGRPRGYSREEVGWLLEEAVHDHMGLALYDEIAEFMPADSPEAAELAGSWIAGAAGALATMAQPKLVNRLISDLARRPRFEPPRYWSSRQLTAPPVAPLALPELVAAFAALVEKLNASGYFDEAFSSSCPDTPHDPAEVAQDRLAQVLGTEVRLWPPGGLYETKTHVVTVGWDWGESILLDLVEALDDLVARPRRRSWHTTHDGWDFSDFDRTAGRAVYRWQVNELLARSEVGLTLATGGEEDGHLVHVTSDPRDQLVDQAKQTPHTAEAGTVEHAIALFRARSAGRDEKRSAVVALAGILESRRGLLKAELVSKDEGALFHIANRFDLRHRDAKQLADYDDVFLDWVFWWYLATIELTDRIQARRAEPPP